MDMSRICTATVMKLALTLVQLRGAILQEEMAEGNGRAKVGRLETP